MNTGIKAFPFFVLAILGCLIACDGSDGGSDGGGGGCGGGCLGPGECYSSSDCAADQYCLQQDCYPWGQCALIPGDCPADPSPACGCNGTAYDSSCAAAVAGQSAHLSLTECSDLPAGQFPCGAGFCSLADEYCRQGSDGALACLARPAECADDPSCGCLAGEIGCGLCTPTKGGGALATECTD